MNTTSNPHRVLAALTVIGIGTAHALVASAQVAAPAQAAAAADQLTEIVVTAEKREERLQDTPISITAISGADLAARGISSTADALQAVPSVSFQSAGPAQTEYTIRGLSSEGPAVSTVGFYLDDVPMTAPSGAQNGHVVIDPDLYDLNRVEVLRGPQGTLYGSGSMGGTIKLITNQPNLDKFEASTKVIASDTQGGGFNRGINAMANLPLIDGTLALRLVATDEYTSGWIDRIVTSNFPLPTNPGSECPSFYGCTRGNVLASPASAIYHNVNDEELKGTRATLRYQATDQFSLTASAFYQSISQDGLSYFDSPPGTEAHYQPFNVPEPFSDTFRLYNLVGEYKAPAFTVTSVSSYWTRSQAQTQDISETVQTIFGLPSFDPADGGIGPEAITEQDYTKQFSQEIRLASNGGSAFKWLIGAFYSDYDYGQNQYSLAAGLLPLFGSTDLFTGTVADNQKQTAEFGEVSYQFPDDLKATLGLRHYAYTQTGVDTDIGIVYGTFTPVPVRTAASDSGLNPKFTLSYDIVDNLMVYGTAAKGFRPGAPNGPIPTSGADSCLPALEALGKTQAPSQYGPDTLWSFELGEKATLLDKRLTIDAAVYNERWSKVQQGIELSCGDGYIDNVGTASVWGGEIEVNAKLSPSWMLSQSNSYTHAVITSTEPGTNVTPGEKLLNVPDYTSNTSIVYSHPIADYTFIARASNVLIGPSESQSFYLMSLPGYDIVRFRTGLDATRWSAFLYVDNLTNKQAFLAYTHDYAENIPSLNRVATNQPRTIGLDFQFHY